MLKMTTSTKKAYFAKFFSRAKLMDAVITILKNSQFYFKIGSPPLSQLLQMDRDSAVFTTERATEAESFKILMVVLTANHTEKTKLS